MTIDDIDSLPEFKQFGEVVTEKDGMKYVQPTALPMEGWEMPGDDDPVIAQDRAGNFWRFIKLSGVIHKIRD
jgi:hypothetical protein